MRSIVYVAISAMLISGLAAPCHATETQRSPKQEAKRLAAMTNLTPDSVAKTASVKDDPFEPLVTIATENAFKWRGGFTDTVRSDNFLRALLDRKAGEASYQLYQTLTYTGDWRRFDRVHIMLPSGLKTMPLTVLSRDVVTCAGGVCVYEEIVGFNISDNDIDAVSEQYTKDPTATLKFRFKSNAALDWNDDISGAEIVGLVAAIEQWRAKAGLADRSLQ